METGILAEFGLTRNEIAIFLCLVRKGALSATQVAKETGQNRPYVYYALERLLEKGYISTVASQGKRLFKALPLDHIISSEEQKLALLKGLLADLKKAQEGNEEEVSVEVLKGKYVIKNVFKKVLSELRSGDEHLCLGVDEEKMEELEPLYLKKLLNEFPRKRITERVIIKRGAKRLEYAKATRYRYVPPELLGNTARFIYRDTVIDIIYGEPVYAVIAKNGKLADTARKQFELFWRMASEGRNA